MFWDGKWTLRNLVILILVFIALVFVVAWITDVAVGDDAPPADQVMAPLGEGWDDVQIEEWEELEYVASCETEPWLCEIVSQQPEPEPYWEPEATDWEACQRFWDGEGEWQPGC